MAEVTDAARLNALRSVTNAIVSVGRLKAKIETLQLDPAMDVTASTALTDALATLNTGTTHLAAAVTAQAAAI